jgi:hypothetical protein
MFEGMADVGLANGAVDYKRGNVNSWRENEGEGPQAYKGHSPPLRLRSVRRQYHGPVRLNLARTQGDHLLDWMEPDG